MSDYKFKVGDRIRILKMDEFSIENMVNNIGRIGIITNCDNEEDANGYVVNLGNDFWYYMENSLELAEPKDDYNEKLISKDNVLSILYETKENGIFNYGTICDLIRRVRELPCK